MNIRLNRCLILSTVGLLPSCQESSSDKTIRQEKVGDTYLYLGERYGKSHYKPMYIFNCQTENQYEDKDMILNDTWFSTNESRRNLRPQWLLFRLQQAL